MRGEHELALRRARDEVASPARAAASGPVPALPPLPPPPEIAMRPPSSWLGRRR